MPPPNISWMPLAHTDTAYAASVHLSTVVSFCNPLAIDGYEMVRRLITQHDLPQDNSYIELPAPHTTVAATAPCEHVMTTRTGGGRQTGAGGSTSTVAHPCLAVAAMSTAQGVQLQSAAARGRAVVRRHLCLRLWG